MTCHDCDPSINTMDNPNYIISNQRSLKFGHYITYIASKPKAHSVITKTNTERNCQFENVLTILHNFKLVIEMVVRFITINPAVRVVHTYKTVA